MHGRARVSAPEPEEERQERLKKIAKYCKISETVLSLVRGFAQFSLSLLSTPAHLRPLSAVHLPVAFSIYLSPPRTSASPQRHAGVQNAESLGLTQKILEINPEFYTLWNYRREIIQSMMTAGHLTAQVVGESEKSLTQLALEKNPKSYCAWHHRRWVAELGCVDLGEELATCTKFLNLDARNCTLSICQLCTPSWAHSLTLLNSLSYHFSLPCSSLLGLSSFYC
jgi:hypothetical protein